MGSTTDTTPLLMNLKTNGLEFDGIYTSEMIGKYKPHSLFYQYILEKEGYTAEHAVFVGDSLIDDVYGPQSVGLKSVLIDRSSRYDRNNINIVPDYVINNFRHLLELKL